MRKKKASSSQSRSAEMPQLVYVYLFPPSNPTTRQHSREQLLELAARLEVLQVGVAADVLAVDKDVGDSALARLASECILDGGALALVVQLEDPNARDVQRLDRGLGLAAVWEKEEECRAEQAEQGRMRGIEIT